MNARTRAANPEGVRPDREFVLYWMTSARRLRANHALDRAIARARELRLPLLVLEPLRLGYPWASDRIHRFVLEGMAANADLCRDRPLTYFPYVETVTGAGKGLLAALSRRAALVVADDRADFFYPHMLAAAAQQVEVALEAVDSVGLLPFRSTPKAFSSAFIFRRHLQKTLPTALGDAPDPDPLRGLELPRLAEIPGDILARWPLADPAQLAKQLGRLPIDHQVPIVDSIRGGTAEARRRLERLVEHRDAYARDRNHPDPDAASGLSPYLHFGQIGTHEILAALADAEGWTPSRLSAHTGGARSGWWGMSEGAEAFLDQVVTWRELGFNMAVHHERANDYDSLPAWARATLREHADDRRPYLYTLEQFESASTHDPLWNAAQRQLREQGIIHNYLRMLWGKQILHWSRSPEEALDIMLHLNNKWALDGRDPNSTSGIFWCLGRYDRAWGPKRPVFGSIRYMTSDSARRKLRLKEYLERFGPRSQISLFGEESA